MIRALLLPAVLTLAACEPQNQYIPMLDDLDASASDVLDLVDRDGALNGAKDYDLAKAGDPLDLATTPDGYQMIIDSSTVVPDDGRMGLGNILAGSALVILGDIAAALIIAPPAIGIAVAVDGEITEMMGNVWYAENTIPWFGAEVTAHLTVAWVGVGWLSEMRLSSNTGMDHQLWFNGFVSYNGAVGWWDFFDNDQLVGVLEWVTDGTSAQLGVGMLGGDVEGDILNWTWIDGGDASFTFHDADIAETSWVIGHADGSGEVRMPDHLGGVVSCWGVDSLDMECAL